jgi:hypothetical protein
MEGFKRKIMIAVKNNVPTPNNNALPFSRSNSANRK